MPKIYIEGNATIASNRLSVICGFCNHTESEHAIVEIDASKKSITFVAFVINQKWNII